MKYYLKVLQQYADFNGRARRKEYWMFILFNFIAGIILAGVGIVLKIGALLFNLYAIIVFIPSVAVLVRRLHDVCQNKKWVYQSLIVQLLFNVTMFNIIFDQLYHNSDIFRFFKDLVFAFSNSIAEVAWRVSSNEQKTVIIIFGIFHFILSLAIFILSVQDSQMGANQYGADPKEGERNKFRDNNTFSGGYQGGYDGGHNSNFNN